MLFRSASVGFDQRLWKADITGSLAHAEMLAAQNIISADDHASIQRGMAQITSEIEAGQFDWNWERSDDGGVNWRVLWQIRYTRRHVHK